MYKIDGFTEAGNTTLTISGAAGTIARRVQGSFPSCTVTVYNAGTLTLSSIYSDDNASPTAKANPFTAGTDGRWFAYAAPGRYDVQFSGGSLPAPFTIGDLAAGIGASGAVSYAFASLPTVKTQDSGNLLRVTDNVRGLWMSNGTKWFGVNGEQANVIEFGADRTGVADSSTAIRAAIVATQALSQGSSYPSGGGPTSVSNPTIFFPRGIYRIDADIGQGVALNGLCLVGNQAILQVASGVTLLSKVGYMFYMDGITVRGGATVLSIDTGNADTTQIILDDCQFWDQSVASIISNGNSGSTQLFMTGCKGGSALVTTGQLMVIPAGGVSFVNITNCWFESCNTTESLIDVYTGSLVIDRCLFIPLGNHSWITCRGGRIFSNNSSYSAESPVTFADIICRMPPDASNQSGITITGGTAQAATGAPLVYFYRIPNSVYIDNVSQLVGQAPFKVDATCPAGDLATIGDIDSRFVVKNNAAQYGPYISIDSPTIAREGLPLVDDQTILSSRPPVAALILQSAASTALYTPTISANDVSGTTPNDEFGFQILQWDAIADDGYYDKSYTSALNGLSAGVYTCVFDFAVITNTTVQVIFQAGKSVYIYPLTLGNHIINIPFYYDGGASQTIRLATYGLIDNSDMQWQKFRVYTGNRRINTKRCELEGTTFPVAGEQFYRGDIVYNTARTTTLGPVFWECILAGISGTWAQDHYNSTSIATGTFTLAAAATTTVNNASAVTGSLIFWTPTNAAAGTLMGSSASLKLASINTGVSFTVGTASGAAAAGTETFSYIILINN